MSTLLILDFCGNEGDWGGGGKKHAPNKLRSLGGKK